MADPEVVLSTPTQELARPEPALMDLIQQIITSPNAKDQVEVVKAMLDMQVQVEAKVAKEAFATALHDIQAQLEPMTKDGVIRAKGVVRSRFTKNETVDAVLRPLMNEHGFSFQMSETGIDAIGRLVFEGTLIHKQGHESTKRKPLPLDKNEYRSGVQSEGSTVTYARRLLLKMHFNIVETDENPELDEPISAEEAMDLSTQIQDVKGNLAVLLKQFGVASLKDLTKGQLRDALQMVEDKKSGARK